LIQLLGWFFKYLMGKGLLQPSCPGMILMPASA
jgi:hypothetical protein